MLLFRRGMVGKGPLYWYTITVMSSAQKDKIEITPPEKSPVTMLMGTIGDTTWRMFVPTIGLTLLGYYLDTTINTLPWFTIIGIIVGGSLSALLVYRQLKKEL